jgi:AraC-like DNA-binding protein
MSSFSIGRIADLLGYSDIYHFSKQFKEKTGIPPSRFRAR